MSGGRLIGVGVGPGDSELLTLKALRTIRDAPVLAFVAAGGQPSIARQIAAPYIPPDKREINITLPLDGRAQLMRAAFDEGASRIAAELELGLDVALLCEDDPLFYGFFIQFLGRLGQHYPSEVVPGVLSIQAASASARLPLVWRSRSLTVVPGSLPEDRLRRRLRAADAAVILDPGLRLPMLRRVLDELGMLGGALYVERLSRPEARIVSLAERPDQGHAPPGALVVVPVRSAR